MNASDSEGEEYRADTPVHGPSASSMYPSTSYGGGGGGGASSASSSSPAAPAASGSGASSASSSSSTAPAAASASVSLVGKYRQVPANGDDADCIMEESERHITNADAVMATFTDAASTTSEQSRAVKDILAKFMNSSKRYSGITKSLRKKVKSSEAQVTTLTTKVAKLEAAAEKARLAMVAFKSLTVKNIGTAKDLADKAVKVGAISSRHEIENAKKVHKTELEILLKTSVSLCEAQTAKIKAIAAGIDEVHFTQLFGLGSSRESLFCPISQATIVPPEPVVCLISDCKCNCMVKRVHGSKYMKDMERGDRVKCLTCRAAVSAVVATTASKGEEAFAWRAMARLAPISTEQELVDKQVELLEVATKRKTAQDTAAFRAYMTKLELLTKDAPKI
jgi:hypothetical protein